MMRGIIFDMDGVLFPTEELKFRAYAKVFADVYGVRITDTRERLGVTELLATKIFFKQAGIPFIEHEANHLISAKRISYYDIISSENFFPLPGALQFLRVLKDSNQYRIGLATSSTQKATMILLERFNFGIFFDRVISLEQVRNTKPDPEIYLQAAKCLGIAPQFCIGIEDSPVGLEALHRANIKSIAVTTDLSVSGFETANLAVASLEELTLKKLTGLFAGYE